MRTLLCAALVAALATPALAQIVTRPNTVTTSEAYREAPTDRGEAAETSHGITRHIDPDMKRETAVRAPIDRRGTLKLKEKPHRKPIPNSVYAAPSTVRK